MVFLSIDLTLALPSIIIMIMLFPLCKGNSKKVPWGDWFMGLFRIYQTLLNNLDILTDIMATLLSLRYLEWSRKHDENKVAAFQLCFYIQICIVQFSLLPRYIALVRVVPRRIINDCVRCYSCRKRRDN